MLPLLLLLFPLLLTPAHSLPARSAPPPPSSSSTYAPTYVAHIIIHLTQRGAQNDWLTTPACLDRGAHLAAPKQACGLFGITELSSPATTRPQPIEIRNLSPGAARDGYCAAPAEQGGVFACESPPGEYEMGLEAYADEGVTRLVVGGEGAWAVDINSEAVRMSSRPSSGFRARVRRVEEAWSEPVLAPAPAGRRASWLG
ncbi:MAG: hypothetical protein M1829_000918, partial [Trizodia sp. TS-e1964]